MASTKVRALISIVRVLVGIGVGYAIYYSWSVARSYDPWYYAVGAGVVSAVMGVVMLDKLKGGGD